MLKYIFPPASPPLKTVIRTNITKSTNTALVIEESSDRVNLVIANGPFGS